ncbi:MAG: alcohol dehydrogenase catalytic domain-containing protein [Clostridiales bacterium]|jgi:L-iditol 2-dehydrogenase|nr:alcohol dehydrogenase catalytic domain-containing protein [Clostridiales bacterium]
MKAIVKTKLGKGNLELKEVPIPNYKDSEVLIKVKAMGICGSDILIYKGEFNTNVPIILGHEFSGEIVDIGNNVSHFKVGDRVASELNVQSCGWCSDCRKGDFHLCSNRKAPGIHMNGVFAEYVALPEFILHRIPDNLSYEEGAVMEPAAVAAHGVIERAGIHPEDVVAIIGCGNLGLLSLQIAKNYGAKKVIISGTNKDVKVKFPKAMELGADYVINIDEHNIREAVDEITGGKGADLVIECAGNERAVDDAIDIVRKNGRLCTMGMPGERSIPVPWKKAVFKNIDLKFSYSSSASSWNMVSSMLERCIISTKPLITHKERFENYLNILENKNDGDIIKAILHHEL